MMKETSAEHLAVEKLRPFEGHPFKVVDNEEMDQLTWSILTQGLLTPLVVRPQDDMPLCGISIPQSACSADSPL